MERPRSSTQVFLMKVISTTNKIKPTRARMKTLTLPIINSIPFIVEFKSNTMKLRPGMRKSNKSKHTNNACVIIFKIIQINRSMKRIFIRKRTNHRGKIKQIKTQTRSMNHSLIVSRTTIIGRREVILMRGMRERTFLLANGFKNRLRNILETGQILKYLLKR